MSTPQELLPAAAAVAYLRARRADDVHAVAAVVRQVDLGDAEHVAAFLLALADLALLGFDAARFGMSLREFLDVAELTARTAARG